PPLAPPINRVGSRTGRWCLLISDLPVRSQGRCCPGGTPRRRGDRPEPAVHRRSALSSRAFSPYRLSIRLAARQMSISGITRQRQLVLPPKPPKIGSVG